jgi:hypothetical protein
VASDLSEVRASGAASTASCSAAWASVEHLHNATQNVQEEDLVVETGMANGLGLTLLLPICHHVEALDTVVVHKLAELGKMVTCAD